MAPSNGSVTMPRLPATTLTIALTMITTAPIAASRSLALSLL
jgi:hypothetical protein